MNLEIPTWIAGLLACGMGVALLGSVKIALAQRLHMDEVRVGGLVSMFGFTMIPVMLAMGFLTDLLDKQVVVIGGAFLMVASLLVLARSTKYWSTLVAVLLLSAGWSAMVNVLNVLMQSAFGGTQTYAMNLGNFFFGLGAFLTPLLIAFLLRRAGFAPALLVLAAFALVSGVLSFGVDFKGLLPPAVEGADPGIGVLLSDRIMWLTALALLFYAPMEATMAAWATTYLGDRGLAEGRAATVLVRILVGVHMLASCDSTDRCPFPVAGRRRYAADHCPVDFVHPGMGRRGAESGSCHGRHDGRTGGTGVWPNVSDDRRRSHGPRQPRHQSGTWRPGGRPVLHGRRRRLVGYPDTYWCLPRKTSIQRGFLIAVAAAVGLTVTAVALHVTSVG